MAVGTCVSFAIQALIMLWMLDRREGGLGLRESATPIIKMIIASGLMWAACIGLQRLPIYPHGSGKIVWAAQLMALMGTVGLVYFAACAAMGIDVLSHIKPRRRDAEGNSPSN